MVRKGGQQARAPAAAQQPRQPPQNKRGRGRVVASQQANEGYTNQHAFDQQAATPCLARPATQCDLGMALQRMGVLPVLPAASERKLALSDPQQSAYLKQLNTFLDTSYELQQRGHLLWVAEQMELQRGAELAILSPPSQGTDCQETQPAHFTHQATPIKVCQGAGQTGGSPTDVLMSPQTASTLLAAAMASQGGMSPSMTGSAAAQLLSPSALGFAPLLLQDLPHNQRRRLGISAHSMMSPNGTTFNLEAAGLEESCHSQGLSNAMHHHMDDDNLMSTGDHGYGHHQHGLISPRFALHGRVAAAHPTAACPGLPATSDVLRSMREHLRQQQHHPAAHNGARTPRGLMLPSSLQQPSPLSPADLLVTGGYPQSSCMDHGLIGAYAVHHHSTHLDCDLHAELRLDAGGPLKRARR